MKFYIETFGCKVNAYESNYLKEALLSEGFLFTHDLNEAEIVLVNTCTVTNTSDSKCKKFVRKVKRENPKAILVVFGCSSQNKPEEYKEIGVDILLGNKNKVKIPSLIKDYLKTKEKYYYVDKNRDLEFESMMINDFNHTRAFIKIQDGCDNFCSYCIIPFMRGKCRSKNFEEIIKEAKELSKNHQEIVLTGIHTGSYSDNGHDLVDVINELSKIDNIKRIRLSSVEITELNAKFMDMLKTNEKFCNHLHIPLQAGSNHVLSLMNRKYNMEYFFNKIKEIRSIRPDIAISTDIIVGFPEETDKDFMETYENAKKLAFSKIHVFPYSKRDGTKASLMKEVPSIDKSKRDHKLLNLSDILEKQYQDKFIGKPLDILIEEVKNGKSIGHSSNYIRVVIDKELTKNKIYNIIYDGNKINS